MSEENKNDFPEDVSPMEPQEVSPIKTADSGQKFFKRCTVFLRVLYLLIIVCSFPAVASLLKNSESPLAELLLEKAVFNFDWLGIIFFVAIIAIFIWNSVTGYTASLWIFMAVHFIAGKFLCNLSARMISSVQSGIINFPAATYIAIAVVVFLFLWIEFMSCKKSTKTKKTLSMKTMTPILAGIAIGIFWRHLSIWYLAGLIALLLFFDHEKSDTADVKPSKKRISIIMQILFMAGCAAGGIFKLPIWLLITWAIGLFILNIILTSDPEELEKLRQEKMQRKKELQSENKN